MFIEQILSRAHRTAGMVPTQASHGYITLLGRLNGAHDNVVSYHLFSHMPCHYHRSFENDPWLQTGIRITHLSDVYSLATRLWAEINNVSSKHHALKNEIDMRASFSEKGFH